MSTRRGPPLPSHMLEPEKRTRGKCIRAICFSWKVITCIVSHVTLVLLVVSYCVGGAYLFQHLEKPHEIEVKKGIRNIRLDLTDKIWKFSDNVSVLSENDWISNVKKDLVNFEKQILTAMKTDGWDGDEDISTSQWTFAGSLFYSIIVITTIGYGHISPRTDWGKVTTIFYAIIGIPLMLLCLSNIGDVMATSFRFIYWRVCCYICTRNSKRSRSRSRHRSVRSHRYSSRSQPPPQFRYSSRSQPPPFRRSMKLTQRSANDSGLGHSIGMTHAYSDPELRMAERNEYEQDFRGSGKRRQHASSTHRVSRHQPAYEEGSYYPEEGPQYTQTLNRGARFSSRQRNRDRMHERHTVERERNLSRSKPHFDSIEEMNGPPMAKRTMSMRSVRSPNVRRDEVPRETREQRDPRDARDTRESREARDLRQSRELRELEKFHAQTLPRGRGTANSIRGRAKSVDPRIMAAQYEHVDEEVVRRTPIITNRYAIDELEHRESRKSALRSQSMPRSAHRNKSNFHTQETPPGHRRQEQQPSSPHPNHVQRQLSFSRQQSLQHSRYGNRLELPEMGSPPSNRRHSKRGASPRREVYEEAVDEYYMEDYDVEAGYDDYAAQQTRQRERKRRERTERLPPSPRIMSPMGFAVKRQVRRRPSFDYDEDSYGDEWSDYYGDISPKDRPVPIWLCVFLVISYILGGAALFAYWESWSFLDSAYFCFITLTTIGFGDFVPAKGVKDESEQSIAYCSLYLLFGIALLAMSFNLVQEEFIANVKEVARRLGILKDEEDDD